MKFINPPEKRGLNPMLDDAKILEIYQTFRYAGKGEPIELEAAVILANLIPSIMMDYNRLCLLLLEAGISPIDGKTAPIPAQAKHGRNQEIQ